MKTTIRSLVLMMATGLFSTAVVAQPSKSPNPYPAAVQKDEAVEKESCKVGPDYVRTISKRPPFRRVTTCETVHTATSADQPTVQSGR